MLLKDLTTLTASLASGTLFHVEKSGKAYNIDYTKLAKAIVEEYNGSTLGESAQTVQAAIGALNSRLQASAVNMANTLTATGCTLDRAYFIQVGQILYVSIRFSTTRDIKESEPVIDGFPRALTNYAGMQNVRLYDYDLGACFDAQISHADGASKSFLAPMVAIPSGHQVRGTFSYVANL